MAEPYQIRSDFADEIISADIQSKTYEHIEKRMITFAAIILRSFVMKMSWASIRGIMFPLNVVIWMIMSSGKI